MQLFSGQSSAKYVQTLNNNNTLDDTNLTLKNHQTDNGQILCTPLQKSQQLLNKVEMLCGLLVCAPDNRRLLV